MQSSNKVSDLGAKAIAEWLEFNNSLSSLDLVSYFILVHFVGHGGKSSLHFCCSAVTELLQKSNIVSDEGALRIASSLKVNSFLKFLNLVSALAFCFVFWTCCMKWELECDSLTHVAQSLNPVGEASAEGFGDCLKANMSLKKLYLYDVEYQPLSFRATSSIIRNCLKGQVSHLQLHYPDCNACVSCNIWFENDLPVIPPQIIQRGWSNVFQYVRDYMYSADYNSCRVMVVGPQMVRTIGYIGCYVLIFYSGWQN